MTVTSVTDPVKFTRGARRCCFERVRDPLTSRSTACRLAEPISRISVQLAIFSHITVKNVRWGGTWLFLSGKKPERKRLLKNPLDAVSVKIIIIIENSPLDISFINIPYVEKLWQTPTFNEGIIKFNEGIIKCGAYISKAWTHIVCKCNSQRNVYVIPYNEVCILNWVLMGLLPCEV